MTTTYRTRIQWVLALAVVAAVVMLEGIRPAEAAFPGTNGKIAFQSDRQVAAGEIYSIIPGGTAKRITISNGSTDPAYSPDGSRIAFVSTGNQIFVMNADGSGRRQITTSATVKSQPTWSPDGSRIAYVSNSFDVDGQTDLEIWAINADGTGRTQLTKNTPFADTQPAWSPLGDKIAFVSARTGETDRNVYVMDADGSNQVSVTPNSPPGCSPNCYQGHDDNPSWSPDGSKIAYVHGYGPPENPFAAGGPPNIWVMDSDPATNDWTNLSSNDSRTDIEPAWSPDGSKIAYVGVSDSNRNIYVMNSNGSGQTSVDTDLADDRNPDWQPGSPACDIAGDANNNTLTGTTADETLCGLGGNDVINGGGGNDILMGGLGNDTLVAASGRVSINGGDGSDTASFAGSATPIEASLVSGFARRATTDPLEGAALVGIERLTGSSLGDSLTGSGGPNRLVGGAGADELSGLGGNDKINSRDGAKNDTVNGGPGTDACTTDNREVSIKGCE
jgi:Tol biopolymer transport system component